MDAESQLNRVELECFALAAQVKELEAEVVAWQQQHEATGREWIAATMDAERAEDRVGELEAVLGELSRAFDAMPDAGLADPDPRRAWWFATADVRDAARAALSNRQVPQTFGHISATETNATYRN